jgi:hypothetical protein
MATEPPGRSIASTTAPSGCVIGRGIGRPASSAARWKATSA